MIVLLFCYISQQDNFAKRLVVLILLHRKQHVANSETGWRFDRNIFACETAVKKRLFWRFFVFEDDLGNVFSNRTAPDKIKSSPIFKRDPVLMVKHQRGNGNRIKDISRNIWGFNTERLSRSQQNKYRYGGGQKGNRPQRYSRHSCKDRYDIISCESNWNKQGRNNDKPKSLFAMTFHFRFTPPSDI
jgi:hypothetical protein